MTKALRILLAQRLDRVTILGMVALIILYMALFSDLSGLPTEDAAMLMRYSRNLAAGWGIVWNPGEMPVDGATDFLFMVLLAGLNRLGLPLETAVLAVGILSHVLSVIIIYWTIRRVIQAPWWMAVLSACYAAVGPGLRYTEAYFGTAFFSLAACFTLSLAYRFGHYGRAKDPALSFALSSLVMGLIRPEGVFLSLLIVWALVIRNGWKASRKLLLAYFLVHAVLGGAYFLWRWGYFGYAFPNPYYRKGAGVLHPAALLSSGVASVHFALPFAWVYAGACITAITAISERISRRSPVAGRLFTPMIGLAVLLAGLLGFELVYLGTLDRIITDFRWGVLIFLGLGAVTGLLLCLHPLLKRAKPGAISALHINAHGHVRDTLFVLIPMVGFTGIWILLSDEMNFLSRFQYPVLMMVSLSWPLLATRVFPERVGGEPSPWKGAPPFLRSTITLLGAAMMAAYPFFKYVSSTRTHQEGVRDMGTALHAYEDKGYTMAISEAGLLPYYSGWHSIDTWGLNDSWIAHHGGINEAYLDRYKPEIIMFNTKRESLAEPPPRPWECMVDILAQYARENDYVLAAVYGYPSGDQWHYYWVRRDFPDSAAIVEQIRAVRYVGGGGISQNLVAP